MGAPPRESAEDRAATSIAADLKRLANEPAPAYRAIEVSTYPAHQRDFARLAEAELRALGFEKLGDFDSAASTANPDRPQMISLYARADGRMSAAAYSIRPRWPGVAGWLVMLARGQYRTANVIEIETAFIDGSVIATSNAGAANVFGQGPHFDQELLPPGTPAAALFERHEARLRAARGGAVRSLFTVADLRRQQADQVAAKNAYRVSIGYATDEELRKLMGWQFERMAPKVREKLG